MSELNVSINSTRRVEGWKVERLYQDTSTGSVHRLTGLIVESDGKDSQNARRLDNQGIVETCQVCILEGML